jgi:aminoglycoside phosphotransferase
MTHPESIQKHLAGYTTTGENHRTSSQSQIYLYQKVNAPDLFLKINIGNTDAPLILEKKAMNWLQGKLPVPRVIAYCETGETTYLLTERISGTSSEQAPHTDNKKNTVAILAKGLRTIHNISISKCPLPTYSCEDLILEAKKNVQEGIITAQSLQKRGDARTPQEALEQVISLHPQTEHLTFTHGDYCLPNVMIHNNTLSGFIDWGSSGVGDPHRDLVSAQYSIRRNLGEEWLGPFFNQYGRDQINENTLAFYSAIYELT